MSVQSRFTIHHPVEHIIGECIDEETRQLISVKQLSGSLDLVDETMLLGPECPKYVAASGNVGVFAKMESAHGLVSATPINYTMADRDRRERTFTNKNSRFKKSAYYGFYLVDKETVMCFWCDVKLTRPSEISAELHMKKAPWCLYARAVSGRDPTADERQESVDLLMKDPSVRELASLGYNRGLLELAMGYIYDRKIPSLNTSDLLRLCAYLMELEYKYDSRTQVGEHLQCKVCMDAVVAIAFLPCGHACSCVECSKSLGSCPICRSSVVARHIVKIDQ